MDEEESISRRP